MLTKNQDSYVHSHVGILTRAKPRAVPESAPAAEIGTIAPGHTVVIKKKRRVSHAQMVTSDKGRRGIEMSYTV